MTQYIDKNALLARIKQLKMDIGNIFNEYDEGFWEGRLTAFDDVICALNTLEVKEVDLEEEDVFIEKAIGWIDYNNRNGGCFFDGWEKDLRKYMKGE